LDRILNSCRKASDNTTIKKNTNTKTQRILLTLQFTSQSTNQPIYEWFLSKLSLLLLLDHHKGHKKYSLLGYNTEQFGKSLWLPKIYHSHLHSQRVSHTDLCLMPASCLAYCLTLKVVAENWSGNSQGWTWTPAEDGK
jgi:hypothetical protein